MCELPIKEKIQFPACSINQPGCAEYNGLSPYAHIFSSRSKAVDRWVQYITLLWHSSPLAGSQPSTTYFTVCKTWRIPLIVTKPSLRLLKKKIEVTLAHKQSEDKPHQLLNTSSCSPIASSWHCRFCLQRAEIFIWINAEQPTRYTHHLLYVSSDLCLFWGVQRGLESFQVPSFCQTEQSNCLLGAHAYLIGRRHNTLALPCISGPRTLSREVINTQRASQMIKAEINNNSC